MMLKFIAYLPLALLLAGLGACGPAPVQEDAGARIQGGAPAPDFEDYLTAREGLRLAKAGLSARPRAVLTGIQGRWVDAGGRSRGWSYIFADAGERLVVQEGKLELIEPGVTGPALAESAWQLDSDAVLLQLEILTQPDYPLTEMRLSQVDGSPVWRIESRSGSWRIDAATGALR